MFSRTRRLGVRPAIGLALVLVIAVPSSAQVIINQGTIQIRGQGIRFGVAPDGAPVGQQPPTNLFPLPDRQQLRRLAQAKALIDEGRFADAVRVLGAILEGPEDYFFRPDKEGAPELHRSLKREASRLLGGLPPEGRQVYELLYGARARQLLEEAVRSGGGDRLAEVSRRFFHTQAGYEATFLLGLDYLDRGSPLAGALMLERLKQAPGAAERFEPHLSLALAVCWQRARMPEKVGEVLSTLITRRGPIQLGGKPLPAWRDSSEALEWLERQAGGAGSVLGRLAAGGWLLFGGNPARNASVRGGPPFLSVLWRVPVSDNPNLVHEDPQPTDLLVRLSRMYAQRGMPVVPATYPLVVHGRFDQPRETGGPWHVEDVVLMRTTHKLLAVDLATGKRIWEVPVAEHLAELADVLEEGSRDALESSHVLLLSLGERLWYDTTYGTLSSDGRTVYLIEDLGLPFQARSPRIVVVGGRRVQRGEVRRPYNRLAAIDIATGKLQWAAGGAVDQFLQWPLPETYFLGPPLPLMGQLFVLAEKSGEGTIELLALQADAQSDPRHQGRLLWSQPLVRVETNILEDPYRARAGLSPSYADGVLVCPTASGAVVAVDLATRSLLWAYSYQRQGGGVMRSHVIVGPFGPQLRGNNWPGGWRDSSVTVAEGCVLLTPVDSDALHGLSLADGQPLWKPIPRQGDLYLACVHEGKAVLVGADRVRAFLLRRPDSSGQAQPAWEGRTISLPEGAAPSGRGFLSGGRYYLPLSTAEVAVVDLEAGRIVERIKSRRGTVPGNLVCYRGRVLSQTALGVEMFYEQAAAQTEAQRLLAADANDPVGLRLSGEILLEQGRREEAIAYLRRAADGGTDPRARGLLREALLDALRHDFATYESRVAEIEALLDSPDERATFLRLIAEGLRASGRPIEAFDRYLELIALNQQHPGMEQIGPQHSVRRSRWIRARLAALWEETADAQARSQIEQRVEQRLQAALKTQDVGALGQFELYFGDLPAGEQARRELVRGLAEAGRWREAEMVLWPDFVSLELTRAGKATVALADLLRRAGRPEDAAVCYRRLRDELAEVDCGNGKTGAQLFAALAEDDPVRRACQAQPAWPQGEVEDTAENVQNNSNPTFARFVLNRTQPLGPFFAHVPVEVDTNRRVVTGRDTLGQQRWQLSLMQLSQQTRLIFNRNFTRASACGHMLVLLAGSRLVAVDTLGDSRGGPRVVWHEDLQQSAQEALGFVGGVAGGPVMIANGVVVLGTAQGNVQRAALHAVGPLTSHTICFQRFRDLVGVDPATGQVVWLRHDVPEGSELFGDEQWLFVLPPDEEEALVLRARDGTLVGRRKVPRAENGQVQVVVNGSAMVRGTKYAPLGATCLATQARRLLLWQSQTNGQQRLELYDPWEEKPVWPARRFAAGSVIDVVDGRWVGVCEPNGRLVVLDAEDGGTIIDTELRVGGSQQRLPQLEGLSLFRCDDGFLVVAHAPKAANGSAAQIIQPIAGMAIRAVNRAWVFAFDQRGRPRWPRPTYVADQHLLLDQPPGLPVLVFACQVYDRQPPTPSERYHVSVVCVDKRSGRIVYQERFQNTTHTFELTGDQAHHTVTLRTQRNQVKLTFTDRPLPEPAEAEPAEDQPDALPEGRLLPSLRRALERGMGGALEAAPDGAIDPADLAPKLPALEDLPRSPFEP